MYRESGQTDQLSLSRPINWLWFFPFSSSRAWYDLSTWAEEQYLQLHYWQISKYGSAALSAYKSLCSWKCLLNMFRKRNPHYLCINTCCPLITRIHKGLDMNERQKWNVPNQWKTMLANMLEEPMDFKLWFIQQNTMFIIYWASQKSFLEKILANNLSADAVILETSLNHMLWLCPQAYSGEEYYLH